jgi:CotS family spore coat protein
LSGSPNLRKMGHILAEVARSFGIRIRQWSNIRSIYLVVDYDGEKFAIKPFRQGLSRLNLAVRIQMDINHRDSELMPLLRPTITGRPFYSYQGVHYLCSTWIDGRVFDYLRRDDRMRAVNTWKKWRSAATELKIPKAMQAWEDWPNLWERRIDEMKRCRFMALRNDAPFDRYYLELWDFYYKQANSARERLDSGLYSLLAKRAKNRGEVIHGDWAHHNLTLTPEGKATMFDLEYLQGDLQIKDLCDILVRILQLDDKNPAFVSLLFRWCRKINALDDLEAMFFPDLFRFPEDFWMLGRQYYIERLPRSNIFSLRRLRRKVPEPSIWTQWMAEVIKASVAV